MKWIALTGGIASGKSTAASMIRGCGIAVVSADDLAHEALNGAGRERVLQVFGPDLIKPDQQIDRKKLGDRAFGDPEKLKKLEEILHPIVRELAEKQKKRLMALGMKIAFYEIPLVFEKKMENFFDKIVCVICSKEKQRERIKKRNGLTDSEIDLRLRSQISMEEKAKRSDYIIENNGSESDLKLKVKEMILHYQAQE